LCERAPTKRRAGEPPRRGRSGDPASNFTFDDNPLSDSFRLFEEQSAQRLGKAPRLREKHAKLRAAAALATDPQTWFLATTVGRLVSRPSVC
jgi:hypothetical protein